MAKMSQDSFVNNLSNPARVYLWEVFIPGPPTGDTETYLLRAQSASRPERSFGLITIPFKQTPGAVYPGKDTVPHTWDVTFIEGEDRKIFQNFYDWMNKIIHNRYGTGSPTFKIDIYLHELDTDGTVSNKIKMMGAYPQRMGDVPLSYDREESIMLTVQFAYDRWEQVD